MSSTHDDQPWIKARMSGSQGNCVEMRNAGDAIEVRDSKDPYGPVHRFTKVEFGAWLEGAKRGEFDHLAGL
jgi:Domain of unknown function (DUF397)